MSESNGCDDVFSRLSEYLDRELPESTCEELEQHIADCPPCVQFLDSLRKSIAITRSLETEVTPPPLSPGAREQLRQAFERIRRGSGPGNTSRS